MNRLFFAGLAGMLLTAACKHEEEVKPSELEGNWRTSMYSYTLYNPVKDSLLGPYFIIIGNSNVSAMTFGPEYVQNYSAQASVLQGQVSYQRQGDSLQINFPASYRGSRSKRAIVDVSAQRLVLRWRGPRDNHGYYPTVEDHFVRP